MSAYSLPADLRALSVRQPWAWAILHGGKDIENRTWATRHRGLFVVHAGQQLDHAGYRWLQVNFPHLRVPTPAELVRSALLGVVELTDCFGPEDAHPMKASPWYMGSSGFVLTNPRSFDRPIPTPGKLGFFKLSETARESLASSGTLEP